jgi:phosphatidylethanolamine-binding protein (PEBP) family uncharacterized protein
MNTFKLQNSFVTYLRLCPRNTFWFILCDDHDHLVAYVWIPWVHWTFGLSIERRDTGTIMMHDAM